MRRLLWLLLVLAAGGFVFALVQEGAFAPCRDAEGPDEAPPEGAGSEPARCTAVTRSGNRCTRPAEPGAETCWQHA
jgi:hypothetical protein